MAVGDINRGTTGIVLPRQVSTEIWSTVQETSAVMAVARQVTLPGAGLTVPIVTGDSAAEWTAESAEKPVSHATLGSKNMTPYKLAVIETFSMEFRRDVPALYGELVRRLPGALAKKFDSTVLGGTAPGSGFDVLTGAESMTVDATATYADLAAVFTAVAVAGGRLSHWVASPSFEGLLLSQVAAGDGRPLFISDATMSGRVGSIFGRPVYSTNAALAEDDSAVAGDFANSAIYGTVEGVQVDISDQATVHDGATQVNLWQRNMFAVRAEIEVGFVVRNLAHFVRLTAEAQA